MPSNPAARTAPPQKCTHKPSIRENDYARISTYATKPIIRSALCGNPYTHAPAVLQLEDISHLHLQLCHPIIYQWGLQSKKAQPSPMILVLQPMHAYPEVS
eukprot:1150088-Pelagomonas_calceolata.AAC.5